MTKFDPKYFQKFVFTEEQIENYLASAKKNLEIAKSNEMPEVKFKFAYDALLKLGITLIAKHGYKIRSNQGHHIKILENLSEILENKDIAVSGNKMRTKRNLDLYQSETITTQKEAEEYLKFVETVFKQL